ncbi:MAG: hypothetical protein HOC93_05140 [Phycisphaerae bacterium]|mgnify:FL=1|jgi:hypothetical protein|nr:hypothetical protein [Phycisphaerae bacterium]
MRTQTFIFLAICALVGGCTSYHPVTVSVKNTNGSQISNASVQIAPLYFYNPSDKNFLFIGEYDILEPFPGKGASGITDQNGEVTLEIVEGNPSSLIVLAPNHQRWRGQVSITTQNTVEVIPPNIDKSDLIVTVQ